MRTRTRATLIVGDEPVKASDCYARTTIAAEADAAGVSPETIYLTFGGKPGLLKDVIEMAIAPEADPSTQEDELWNELAKVPDARDRLKAMVEYSCAILARTGPVHAVIRGAADKEPFAAALASRLLRDRLTRPDGADRALPGLRPPHRRVRLDRRASPERADQLAP